MSRKVKSVKYTHFHTLSLKQPLSLPQIQQQTQQQKADEVIEDILESIFEATLQNMRKKQIINQDTQDICNRLEQSIEQYFYFDNYWGFKQKLVCQEEPLPAVTPERQLRKDKNLQQNRNHVRKWSHQKMQHYDLQDFRKTIQKCKKERDQKKSCSNINLIALDQSYRASQDNTQQIQQLMRRKKELFLEVANFREKIKSKVISTERKERKNYFHNDSGEPTQMSFCQQICKVNRLIPTIVKVQQGQCVALNLKKKAIVQFASNNKKSRRRIARNLGDTCIFNEQIKENDCSTWSAVNRAHTQLKTFRIKNQSQNLTSLLKLPAVQ